MLATSTVNDPRYLEHVFSSVPAGHTPFNDPAIMSARFVPAPSEVAYGNLLHGPPPGLLYPHGSSNTVRSEDSADNARVVMNDRGSAHGEPISSLT